MNIKDFLTKYKWWVLVVVCFLAVRLLILVTFWQASASRGGWENFYAFAQSAPSALLGKFHEPCDWHPPLYYTFTSGVLYLFGSQLLIYFFQLAFAFISLIFTHKICRLFFPGRFSLFVILFIAIEPYWAWQNFLLASENLFMPLFLAGFYYFFSYLKNFSRRSLVFAALLFSLAALTRLTAMPITVLASALLLVLFLLRRYMAQNLFAGVSFRRLAFNLFLFNLIFLSVLAPWIVRNKFVYGRFALENITATNYYFYNLPPLISWQKKISYDEAYALLDQKAKQALGEHIGDTGNCSKFTNEEMARNFDFYRTEVKKYILANLGDYSKMHLIRALPFFIQPGYFDMWFAYGGDSRKPDITALILRGDFAKIKSFLTDFDSRLSVYLAGLAFWGVVSLSVFFALIYSYFKDRNKFLFFFFGAAIIVFFALLSSPFVLARYRLPLYIFFFSALVYALGVIYGIVFKRPSK